ncbi:MAG TPA: hypothetical protein PKJ85_08595 [Nitrosomonas nitrosa]|nr:hypothetical protein [Nitrosomonas nitrosa]
MGILTTEQLVHGLKNGRPLTPYSIEAEVIDAYLKIIETQRMVLRTDSPESKQFALHIRKPLDFVLPERRRDLGQCDIYVLPFPICMAYAEESEKRPVIVIASGLINLIANSIFSAYLQSLLPPELDQYYMPQFRKDMPASHLFANALFLMRLQFYRFCKPLPNIFALMTPETLEECKIAINGALVFTLLHELGHHKLKYFQTTRKLRPMHYQFAVKEDLSVFQHQEMEADDFALNSLVEQAKIIGTFWQQQAVSFFLQMELVSGSYGDKHHPMAINRSFYSDTLRKEWGQNYDVAPRAAFYKNTADRYQATKENKSQEINALIQTSREGCLDILSEINQVLLGFGMDIKPLWSTPSPNWLEINQVPE